MNTSRSRQTSILLMIIFLIGSCTSRIKTENDCIRADVFKNPPADFRSAPFYSLNDELDTAELVRQILGFKEAGFGGCFLHSRGGLLIEYMGKDWWAAMDVAVRTSKQLGLKAWFYDEDKWPSGFAGGAVPMISEKFHARCLSRIGKNEIFPKGDSVLFEDNKYKYIVHKARMGNSWFNGTAYVDLLNPEMVNAFIETAYKPYVEKFRSETGNTVPGIFTDEPQISPRVSDGVSKSVSYSPVVLAKFKAMHGYDIVPHVASLFDTIGDFTKIRYHYYRTIALCFEESFSKQIGKYCANKNMIFTGHLNGEESFNTVLVNSGNSMVNYRHMQMPGIDQLGLNYIPVNTPKSVSSVANQYGIVRRLSESYGISGQNMSFEDRKWLLDWLTQQGINFIVPHLSSYSMKGERKRDYPPNFASAQPYWPLNKLFEDYTGRICYINTLGKFAAEILVIHPLETEYLFGANYCYQPYEELLDLLQKNHRNYDLGDEQILLDIAKINGKELEVGKMSYKVIVLPAMKEIRRTTLDILKKFVQNGGAILSFGYLPEYVDGVKIPKETEALRKICKLSSRVKFMQDLNSLFPPEFSIQGADKDLILANHRVVRNGGILQLSNSSRKKEINCKLSFSFEARNLALWNPATGNSLKLLKETDGSINLHFAPTQTWIVSYGDASLEGNKKDVYSIPSEKKEILKITDNWQGNRLDPNAITLDFAKYSINKGKTFSQPEPVIGIHQRLGNKHYYGPLLLKYEVDIQEIPQQCSLVVEQPHLYKFTVNGNEIDFKGKDGFYRDHSFKVQNISGQLIKGLNEIVLSLDYVAPVRASLDARKRYGTEIESLYLIGDFAVTAIPSQEPLIDSQKYKDGVLPSKPVYSFKEFSITKELAKLDGELATNGYPFYTGSFTLVNSFNLNQKDNNKKYYISFPAFEAIAVQVKVNGQEYPYLICSPWQTEITNSVRTGDNKIEVTLINSLRNLLGPHHHTGGELKEVGPASFTGNPDWPNIGGQKDWFDLRLEGKAELWRDDYSIVPFGFLKPVAVLASEN